MSSVTTITKPKQAKKVLKAIARGELHGDPIKIQALKRHCLEIIAESSGGNASKFHS